MIHFRSSIVAALAIVAFMLQGTAVAAPNITASSVAKSTFLDGIHAGKGVSCQQCHGKQKVDVGDTVAQATCLGCHGSYAELAKKTTPERFAKRNPHASHLGDIECVVCHHGHEVSVSYCVGCHKKFDMPIPGGK